MLKSARKRGAASPGRWIWPPRPRRPLQECPGPSRRAHEGRPGGVGTHPGIHLFLCWKGLRTSLMQLLKNSAPPAPPRPFGDTRRAITWFKLLKGSSGVQKMTTVKHHIRKGVPLGPRLGGGERSLGPDGPEPWPLPLCSQRREE